MEKTVYYAAVWLYLAGAAFQDLHTGKVSNRWIAAGLALAILRFTLPAEGGVSSELLRMAGGAAVPFVMLFPFFCLRRMGAGDIKLLMAAGACSSPREILQCMLAAFAAAALAEGLRMALRRQKENSVRLAVYILAGWTCTAFLKK